MYSHTIL